MQRKQLVIFSIIALIIVPIVIVFGVILFKDRNYNLISIATAFLLCIPFFIRFERQKPRAREVILIAIMTTISTLCRVIFAITPGFKPVTAITIITGISLGPVTGFMTGAMTAILSNIYFGQGPWTPFQMICWGLIGYIAGIFGKILKGNKPLLVIYSIIAGIAFSLVMDIWVVISLDKAFNLSRYIATVITGLPTMISYAASNVVFILLLSTPITKKLDRIKLKYGI